LNKVTFDLDIWLVDLDSMSGFKFKVIGQTAQLQDEKCCFLAMFAHYKARIANHG